MLWRRCWCVGFVYSDWEALVCLLVFQSRSNTQQMYIHRWISFKVFDFFDASHWRTGAFPWKVNCVEYSNLWKVFTSHLALTTLMNQKLATRPMIANTERKTPWGWTSLIWEGLKKVRKKTRKKRWDKKTLRFLFISIFTASYFRARSSPFDVVGVGKIKFSPEEDILIFPAMSSSSSTMNCCPQPLKMDNCDEVEYFFYEKNWYFLLYENLRESTILVHCEL